MSSFTVFNHQVIGVMKGKPNTKKLAKSYDLAYEQISQLWKLLPESVRNSLKSDASPDDLEIEDTSKNDALTTKREMKNLLERVNSLKGKQSTYKEKMEKKKLKTKLTKKRKNQEKQLRREEMKEKKKELKEKRKELKEKKAAERLQESSEEERMSVDLSGSDQDEESAPATVNMSPKSKLMNGVQEEEPSLPKKGKNKNKMSKIKIEDLTNSEGVTANSTETMSNKKRKLLLKQKLKSDKKREKKKLKKMQKNQQTPATVKDEEDMEVDEKPIVSNLPVKQHIKFNNIDISSDEPLKKFKKEKLKTEKDPVKALSKIESLDKKITDLKEAGLDEKAAAIKEKEGWKKAIMRAEGMKVKDDVKLLKKSIKKKEKKKDKSKSAWDQRTEFKEKRMKDAQKKRKENISKKNKDKKQKKIKKSIKKGRVVI